MIKNVVFDIGNVVVRWDPNLIAERTFGATDTASTQRDAIFGHPLWLSLNRGEVTEEDVKRAFAHELGVDHDTLDRLFFHIKDSQDLRDDTIALMHALKRQDFRLFALTDNVHEIVRYLREKYTFWDLFEHATVSAEIGALKPSPEIFKHMLSTNDLIPGQTVFFDDVPKNVEGAKAVGIEAFVFTDAQQAIADLATLDVVVGH